MGSAADARRRSCKGAGRTGIVKVEMDTNRQAAVQRRVRAAPTLLLFKDGAARATRGMASKAQLHA